MDEFISTAQAAKLLKVSRVTLFNKIKSGEIKAMKVGRNYIVPHQEILDLQSGGDLSQAKKAAIDKSVERVVTQYGETLRLLKDQ